VRRNRQNAAGGAAGAVLPACEHVVQLVRRRRSPERPWSWRAVCRACGPLGGAWTNGQQEATELGFRHAVEHAEPTQLVIELELPQGRIRRRR
jgi:hypothetical protein